MTNILNVIEKKRDAQVLDEEDFELLQAAAHEGGFPFYQEAALLVAAAIHGLEGDERAGLRASLPLRSEPGATRRDIGFGDDFRLDRRLAASDPVIALIQRKMAGECLEPAEIAAFVRGVADESVGDAAAAAFCMAVYLQGMNREETIALTEAMKTSGEVMTWPRGERPVVDKHSTGGVGDKISLPLVGVLMACGFRIPMISGRGLGFTGGTLDKLESIPGFQVRFPISRLQAQVEEIGAAMVGQSQTLAPADRRLYAIRDVTGTVSSIPLITASILSKKLAEGLSSLVLDVKTGHGAFMQREADARKLAGSLVEVGRGAEVEVAALLTRMDDPLGYLVGNALEVQESIQCLRGKGPSAIETLVIEEAAVLLELEGMVKNAAEGKARARKSLRDGSAFRCFRRLVEVQGGDVAYIDEPDRFERAPLLETIHARQNGWLAGIHAEKVGRAVVELGGGRYRQEDDVDPAVGVRLLLERGAQVEKGVPVLEVHARDSASLRAARELLEDALTYSGQPVEPLSLVMARL